MSKKWFCGTIAGLALLAAACGNPAADYKTRGYGTTSYDGTTLRATDYYNRGGLVGGYSGTLTPNAALGGARTNIGTYGTAGYGAAGYGTTGYGTGYGPTGYGAAGYYGNGAVTNTPFRDTGWTGYGDYNVNTGTMGTRAFDRANYRMNESIYRDVGIHAAGAGGTTVNRIGYVKVDSNYIRTNAQAVHRVHVDRDALAQAVGNVTASVPGVNTSTVLVTDEEIFVGLNTNGRDTHGTKSKARMNALSVSPRYYKVYVTDQQALIDEMTRVASRSSNVNVALPQDERSVDNLIRSFGGTPDGSDVRGRTHAGATGVSKTTSTAGIPAAGISGTTGFGTATSSGMTTEMTGRLAGSSGAVGSATR